jgi:hypothetical protein
LLVDLLKGLEVILHALVVRGEMGHSRSVDRTSLGHAVVLKIGVKRKRYTLAILRRATACQGEVEGVANSARAAGLVHFAERNPLAGIRR